jgi:hypothetical protein
VNQHENRTLIVDLKRRKALALAALNHLYAVQLMLTDIFTENSVDNLDLAPKIRDCISRARGFVRSVDDMTVLTNERDE